MEAIHILNKNDKCCGCGACSKICPKKAVFLQQTSVGSHFPVVDTNKCVKCNICLTVCPQDRFNTHQNKPSHFFAAKRKNIKKLMQSQSGGIFSVLAEKIIKNKGVVYGVESIGFDIKYCRIKKIAELSRIKKSKYVHSTINNIIEDVERDLLKGSLVLFSGLPCQVAALHSYLAKKNVNMEKLLLVDLICHGSINNKVFIDYIEMLTNIHEKKIHSFIFRNKDFGWHSDSSSYKVENHFFRDDSFSKLFYSDYALTDLCYDCPYSSINRIGDISLGDCWSIKKVNSSFEYKKGVSLVLINSTKGYNFFSSISDQIDKTEISEEDSLQQSLQKPARKPNDYNSFWSDYKKYGLQYAIVRYCDVDPFEKNECIKKRNIIKRFITKIKRI